MSDPTNDFSQPDADYDPEAVDPEGSADRDAGIKNPDTTAAGASSEADVNPDELTEDEKDREIRYS
jgi:hypothetical protein